MPLRPVVTFVSPDPGRLRRFWADLLDRHPSAVSLRVEEGTVPADAPEPLHLHLTSESEEQRAATIALVLALGGSYADVGQLPEEDHVVVADPDGRPWCVIEPGNRWLAGCGYLGEVACAGTPEVGRFWSAALGWPLGWDRDGETAVQSPAGGTKLAWSGDPGEPGATSARLDLLGPLNEILRLVGLGATLAGEGPDHVDLRDPDGAPLMLHADPPTA